MTLLAIGAAGVIGMQKVTIQGGTDARRFDIATNLGNEWLARLRRDSLFWTLPNDRDRITSNLDTTLHLKRITDPACNAAAYCLPTMPAVAAAGTGVGDSPAFDVLGQDRPKNSGDHFFCAQMRLHWIADPRGPACNAGVADEGCITGLMRVEIRVFWPLLELEPIGNCETADPDAAPQNFHFVSLASAIRENPDAQ